MTDDPTDPQAPESPEARRDAAVAAIVATGGMVLATAPLAAPADPGTIVAYRVDAGAADQATLDALAAVRTQTETDLTDLADLVRWVDPAAAAADETPGDGGA